MSTRSAAVLASGTANAAKLFAGALVFTSAYVGLSAYSSAGSAARPAHTVTLSAQELPVTRTMTQPVSGETQVRPGAVALSALADGAEGCAKTYVARGLAANPDPARAVQYRWRLARWSPAAKTWRTYLTEYSGFAGAGKTVEWRPRIAANPGWYRVELTVQGAATVKSDRFQVSC